MRYEYEEVSKTLYMPYKDDAFFTLIRLMASSFAFSVSSLLEDADELIFQKHPGASVSMLISMLETCINTPSCDDFQDYLTNFTDDKKQKKWLIHWHVINFYNELRTLHDFLHGSWEEIDRRVFTDEFQINKKGERLSLFQKPKKNSEAFVELTHQMARTHLQELIEQLSSAPYIKSWLPYDPILELTHIMEPYQQREYASTLSCVMDCMCKETKAALKAVDGLFHYARTPESYVFMIRMLGLLGGASHERFDTNFRQLCKENTIDPDSKKASSLKEHLRWLRLAAFFHLPPHVLDVEPVEHRELLSRTINRLTVHHIESVTERLDKEKQLSIERTEAGLLMRWKAFLSTHEKKAQLKKKYDDFLDAKQSGKYDSKPFPYKIPASLSLYDQGKLPIQVLISQEEHPPIKRARFS